jgi:phage gp37-like protein
MSRINQAELAILGQAVASLPANVLRDHGTLPGGWTLDMLKRALQFAPGVYVAFTDGRAVQDHVARIDARFEVYAVTKEPTELSRRNGNSRAIGGYEMIERIAAGLFNYTVPDIGTLQFHRISNLFKEAMFALGGTVYGCVFDLPLAFESNPLAVNDDFLTFHADYDIKPLSQQRYPDWLAGDRTTPTAPDAQDTTTLDGAP